MRNYKTGDTVQDHRYDIAILEDDDPQKLETLKRFLFSDDYMERIAAVKQLESINSPEGTAILVNYFVEVTKDTEFDSNIPLTLEVLSLKRDTRLIPVLKAGVDYCKRIAQEDEDDMLKNMMFPIIDLANNVITELNQKSKTVLEATKKKDLIQVKVLLDSGVNINAKENLTTLHWGCISGDPELVALLVENKADVNQVDSEGLTPLFLTVKDDNVRLTEYLLKNGANPNTANKDGLMPLHLAVSQANVRIIKLLLKYGADRKTRYQERTSLEWAREFGLDEIIKVLED